MLTIQEQFNKAYKVNLPNLFCQITAVFRLVVGNQQMNHTSILTVRKDGSDVEQEIQYEKELYETSPVRKYDAVDFVHIL